MKTVFLRLLVSHHWPRKYTFRFGTDWLPGASLIVASWRLEWDEAKNDLTVVYSRDSGVAERAEVTEQDLARATQGLDLYEAYRNEGAYPRLLFVEGDGDCAFCGGTGDLEGVGDCGTCHGSGAPVLDRPHLHEWVDWTTGQADIDERTEEIHTEEIHKVLLADRIEELFGELKEARAEVQPLGVDPCAELVRSTELQALFLVPGHNLGGEADGEEIEGQRGRVRGGRSE